MKYVVIRSQIVFISVILFVTMTLMMAIVIRHNVRWDLTKEKVFSIAESTEGLLKSMAGSPIEVMAFYPQEDPARANFEIFLKQCQLHHPNFKYNFYDPDRVPSLANQYRVKDLFTVIVHYEGRGERIIGPTEENFTNALLKLSTPKKIELCFVSGHGEASISDKERSGYLQVADGLRSNNYVVHEIILARDKIPAVCQVVIDAGPHKDLDSQEFETLKKGFKDGKGIFFLLDPMDPGTGKSFVDFMKGFGLELGSDVIVDKMSRMAGGDFLVAFVDQYLTDHPITDHLNQPTLFPVARSVQPTSEETSPDLEIFPLAMSGTGSWSERNLSDLEKGSAVFESDKDVAGPIPVVCAVESKAVSTGDKDSKKQNSGGRMVVVGDSDFLTNGYLNLSANEEFALRSIQWLTKDDRYISVGQRKYEFKPLFMDVHQRFIVLMLVLFAMPAAVVIFGSIRVFWRNKTAA